MIFLGGSARSIGKAGQKPWCKSVCRSADSLSVSSWQRRRNESPLNVANTSLASWRLGRSYFPRFWPVSGWPTNLPKLCDEWRSTHLVSSRNKSWRAQVFTSSSIFNLAWLRPTIKCSINSVSYHLLSSARQTTGKSGLILNF